MTAATALVPATRNALALLLLSMADDELVLGFSDSEWTGIAPMLEEDVAMSSLAQDELGHAQALYRLLADLVDDGRDADAIAYDRPAEGYYHARLLDHPRGDWATAIARRYLYDTADAVRLEALADASYEPLRDLVGKIRREERYHVLHAEAWLERLATGDVESRERLLAAMERLGPDAWTVLSPLPNDLSLVMAGILDASLGELDARWRAAIWPTLDRLGLPMPGPAGDPGTRAHGPLRRVPLAARRAVELGPPARPRGHLVTRAPARRAAGRRVRRRARRAAVVDALREVADPEIPVISVVDLGVIGASASSAGRLRVELLPTFVGCPALDPMREAMRARLAVARARPRGRGRRDVRPAVDHRADHARRPAPPRPRAGSRPRSRAAPGCPSCLDVPVPCPWCGSRRTVLENAFGPTACRAIRYCTDCRQPFEQFKQV